jgi:hypothetical protein
MSILGYILVKMKLIVILITACLGTEVQFPIAAAGTRCFGEELSAHDLLVVKASTVREEGMVFNLVIKTALKENEGSAAAVASAGTVVYKEEKKSQVSHAFTSTTSGPHWVCLTNVDSYRELTVKLSMKSGVAAKDYSQIAKKDHLEPTQVAMRRIEDLIHEYKSNLFYQRRRDERMRETIDSTADRALIFCVVNSVIIAAMGTLQTILLRRFFKSKKII